MDEKLTSEDVIKLVAKNVQIELEERAHARSKEFWGAVGILSGALLVVALILFGAMLTHDRARKDVANWLSAESSVEKINKRIDRDDDAIDMLSKLHAEHRSECSGRHHAVKVAIESLNARVSDIERKTCACPECKGK